MVIYNSEIIVPFPLLLPQRSQSKSLWGPFKKNNHPTHQKYHHQQKNTPYVLSPLANGVDIYHLQKVSKELMRNPEAMEVPLLNTVSLGNIKFKLAIHAVNASSQQILFFLFCLNLKARRQNIRIPKRGVLKLLFSLGCMLQDIVRSPRDLSSFVRQSEALKGV